MSTTTYSFGNATIEKVLCLTVLISQDALEENSNPVDAQVYYDNLDCGCDSCPFIKKCLACIMNG